jgi:hypothetical protein
MTDTAQPLPNETDNRPLTPEQLARVAALHEARAVLASKALFGGSLPEPRSVGDLVYLAEWILAGPTPDVEDGNTELEGQEITAEAGWWKPIDDAEPSALDDAQPEPADTQDEAPTEALPAYPEDALPR